MRPAVKYHGVLGAGDDSLSGEGYLATRTWSGVCWGVHRSGPFLLFQHPTLFLELSNLMLITPWLM